MSETKAELIVRVTHRVHPALTLDVDFRLRDEIGILSGVSGSGKSTLLRLIAGLTRPDSGYVALGDRVLFDSSSHLARPLRDRGIGLIFQDDLLFPHRSVAGNVRFGLARWSNGEAEARLVEVAELCGIEHLMDRDPSTLSGGERQRVGLARAIAPRPRLLLCDEPVSALDLEARHALIERIRRVQRLESIPVLYVTHSSDEAIGLGTRLLWLESGRLIADGPPLEVFSTRGPRASFRLRNVFEATVEEHRLDDSSTAVRIADGPTLILPRLDDPEGTAVLVVVGADDIVLARGPIGLLSARNLILGTVERVVRHGLEAEVVVKTGGVSWMVGVIATAVDALGLIEGEEVRMIIKARSCRILREE